MSWHTRQPSQILQEEPVSEYPFIQYVNDGDSLEPREASGGFAMATDQVEMLGAAPNGAALHALHFRNGETNDVYFTPWLRFVPLVTRFAWIKDGNRLDSFVPGARGKLQALGYVETEQGFAGPVLLTSKGMASKDLSEALREHRQAVRKATQGKAPSVFFALLLHAGESTLRGSKQKSRATPILRSDDFDPDRDYVGDALADSIEAEWETYKRWAMAWQHNPGPNGEGELREGDEVTDGGAFPPTTHSADSPPARESTLRLLTALLRGKGYAPDAISATLEGLTEAAAQALLADLKRR
jgi:hypothetical protein